MFVYTPKNIGERVGSRGGAIKNKKTENTGKHKYPHEDYPPPRCMNKTEFIFLERRKKRSGQDFAILLRRGKKKILYRLWFSNRKKRRQKGLICRAPIVIKCYDVLVLKSLERPNFAI